MIISLYNLSYQSKNTGKAVKGVVCWYLDSSDRDPQKFFISGASLSRCPSDLSSLVITWGQRYSSFSRCMVVTIDDIKDSSGSILVR